MITRFFTTLVLLSLVVYAGAALQLPGRMAPAGEITTILNPEQPVYHVRRAATRPVIDGAIDEWQGVPVMLLDKAEQARGWSGPDDLRGAMRMQWDEEGLYFCLEVVDNVHNAPAEAYPGSWWENDCCQFAFDAYQNGPKGGFDPEEHSYLVCDSPSGPVFFGYRMPGTGTGITKRLAEQPLKIGTRPDGAHVYEWSMSWAQLAPLSPWLLGRCGFSWTLNDNDGKGFKGAMFWTKGLIYGQDATQFGQLVFDGAQGLAKPTVLGLRPEEKISGRETSSEWLGVSGTEPWGNARLLICEPQARTVEAGVTVYPQGGAKPVATGTLKQEVPANSPVVFAWDISGLPGGQYELEYTVDGANRTPGDRLGFFRLNVAPVIARRDALRRQFGTDRPWDELKDAPALVRRHRGMVAVLLQLLDDRNWAADLNETDKQAHYLAMLASLAKMVSTLQDEKDYLGKQRGTFWSAYYSRADGSGQTFVLGLPKDYVPGRAYPLIIRLHGAGGVPRPPADGASAHRGFIVASPWGRGGTNGYFGLGEDDVLQVIDYVRTWYKIDPDRIYVSGGSMGGQGTWRMASRHPDLFAGAAPVCGYPDSAPLENLRNVPVFNQHGDMDWSVPVDQSRYAVARLQQLGYAVLHREAPGEGHAISNIYRSDDWLLTLRRESRPAAVTFSCRRPDPPFNRAYWATVREFSDPHQVARVRGTVTGKGDQQSVSLTLENIAVLELDITRMPLDRRHGLLLQVGRQFIQRKDALPGKLFLLNTADGWKVLDTWAPAESAIRPYRAGGPANLYSGEPLMIVYGTKGARAAELRQIAQAFTRYSGGRSASQQMPAGRIPMKADGEVTAEDMLHYNLILIGGAAENELTSMIWPRLPLSINDKNELVAANRPPVKLDGGHFVLSHYNPLASGRLICLVAYDAAHSLTEELKAPCMPIAVLNSDRLVDIPDLAVNTPAAFRQQQFTHGWQWLALPGDDRLLPRQYFDFKLYTTAQLKVLQRMSGVDFALDIFQVQPEKITPPETAEADVRIYREPTQTVTGEWTGEELLKFFAVSDKNWQMQAYPALDEKAIDPRRVYRVALPFDLLWWENNCQLSLRNLQPGPEIGHEEMLQEAIR